MSFAQTVQLDSLNVFCSNPLVFANSVQGFKSLLNTILVIPFTNPGITRLVLYGDKNKHNNSNDNYYHNVSNTVYKG